MSLSTIARLLGDVEFASRPALRRKAADRLRRAIETTSVDDMLFARAREVLEAHGFPPPEPPKARSNAVAQAPVLLAGARPVVGRLTVSREGPPGAIVTDEILSSAAREQLRCSLEAVARVLAKVGAGVPDAFARGHRVRVDLPTSAAELDGPSLGLPAALAVLSRYVGVPLSESVVGTASVSVDGSLQPVSFLGRKIDALQKAFPQAKTLVVAADQDEVPPSLEGLEVRPCSSLEEAVELFGIEPTAEDLPRPSLAKLESELFAISRETPPDHDPEAWLGLARRALLLAQLFGTEHPKGAESQGWAAIFYLHAGAVHDANAAIEAIDIDAVERMAPEARAWHFVTRATKTIDARPAEAETAAQEAVRVAERLEGTHRAAVYGRALGTLGRARTHAGRASAALEPLEQAAQFHAEAAPVEEPRTLCYLATAARLAGGPQRAEHICTRALALVGERKSDLGEQAGATKAYLWLERGRCRLARGQLREAIDDLCRCRDSQSRDAQYPRIGAIWSLVVAYLRNGETGRAREVLDRCRRVAADGTQLEMLRKVAARGLGAWLVTAPQSDVDASLHDIWASLYPGTTDEEAVRDLIENAVY